MATALVSPAAAGDEYGHGGGDPDPGGITVVAEGLNGPRQLSDRGYGSKVYVAESDAGQVSLVDLRRGAVRPVVTGLGENLTQGVDVVRGKLQIAIGEGAPDGPDVPPAPYGSAVLLGVKGNRPPTLLADLRQFELDENPDGQAQFDEGGALLDDALSNPYFVHSYRNGSSLIADAGGNDIVQRTARGDVRLWRALPLITDGACENAPNNTPDVLGCDPVPTGIAVDQRGRVYVSALGGPPGTGKVFVYDRWHRDPVRTISGLTGPTGVEVDRQGNVYVSELLEGAPEGEGPPPEGFDPSTIGRIVKIAPDDRRWIAEVTMPSGLLIHHGELYASAWSVAGLFLQMPDAGQIVRVDDAAFVEAPVS